METRTTSELGVITLRLSTLDMLRSRFPISKFVSGATLQWTGCTGWFRWPTDGRDQSPCPSSCPMWSSALLNISLNTYGTATATSAIESPSTVNTDVPGRPSWHQNIIAVIYPGGLPPKELAGLGEILESLPCEAPHVVIGNILTVRPVEMTGWRETLRWERVTADVQLSNSPPSLSLSILRIGFGQHSQSFPSDSNTKTGWPNGPIYI